MTRDSVAQLDTSVIGNNHARCYGFAVLMFANGYHLQVEWVLAVIVAVLELRYAPASPVVIAAYLNDRLQRPVEA